MGDPVTDLMDHINNALRESDFPTPKNGYFIPKNTLTAITNSSVTRTVWADSKLFEDLADSDRKLVEFISEQAPEIFAIGIYLDQNLKNMMRLFMKHDKSDSSLPMSDAELETVWPEPRHTARRRSFKDNQHLFRPQGFPRQNRFSVIEIQPNVVLPILQSEHMSQGQFGIVYKVKLHEDFLDFNDPIRKVRRNEHLMSHYIWRFCIFN